jgi:uncharacterized protein (DUF433 family)
MVRNIPGMVTGGYRRETIVESYSELSLDDLAPLPSRDS